MLNPLFYKGNPASKYVGRVGVTIFGNAIGDAVTDGFASRRSTIGPTEEDYAALDNELKEGLAKFEEETGRAARAEFERSSAELDRSLRLDLEYERGLKALGEGLPDRIRADQKTSAERILKSIEVPKLSIEPEINFLVAQAAAIANGAPTGGAPVVSRIAPNGNVLSTLGKYALGGAETVLGGVYNYGIRLAGGLASIPYLVDSVDAAVAVQDGFQERYGYDLRSQGARDIGAAVQPVGTYVQDNVLSPLRNYSEARIGDAATTTLFAGTQAVTEIGGLILGTGALGAGGRAVGSFDNLVELEPRLIRTTQTTTKEQGATLKALTESMRKNGFVVEPDKPIDVVRMQDGGLTSLDNTRIVAADLAGVKIKARVSNFDDLLPNDPDFVSRFIGRKGEVPTTFGDAVQNRISNQKKAFRETYPLGSPFVSFGKNFE